MDKEMRIYITTWGRVGNQLTLNNLPESLLPYTFLIIREEERGKHNHQAIVLPSGIENLAQTRQWLLEYHKKLECVNSKMLMLDDDLFFSVRTGEKTKLRKLCDKEELVRGIQVLEQWMDTVPVVGISARQGNNTVESSYSDNTRILRFFGINTAFVTGESFRTQMMSDYDFCLQMLRNGKPNRVLYNFAQDQPASNTAGGCSAYRTIDLLKRSAEELARLHPGFVKMKEKASKSGWFKETETRTDVTIYWKKAFASYHGK